MFAQSFSDDADLQKVTQERDELQNLLDKFERHMAEVRGWPPFVTG